MNAKDIARGIIAGLGKGILAVIAILLGVMGFFYLLIWLLMETSK